MAQSIQEKREERRRRREEQANSDDDDSSKGITEAKGRATPSQRKGRSGGGDGGGNFITRPFLNARDYLLGVQSEMEKVTWPDREETIRLTRIVIVVLIASALFLGGLSILFTEIFNIGVGQPWVFILVFVAFLVALFGYARFSDRGNAPDF